jgi:hypothetical protein
MKSYQQIRDWNCGAAVVRTVLGMHGLKVPSEAWLERELGTTHEEGTTSEAICEYLLGRGLKVNQSTQGCTLRELQVCLQNGYRVLVDYADWGGHWVLVLEWRKLKGWSGGRFKLADPAAKYEGRPDGFTYICGDRLEAMWFDPIPPSTKGLAILVRR